jgi:hypothetical protein
VVFQLFAVLGTRAPFASSALGVNVDGAQAMTHARIGLLSAAAALTVLATPVLAQTYPAYPAPAPAQGYYYNDGPPVIGPVMGAVTAPVTAVGAGMGVAATQPYCRVEKQEGGRLTALCGPP